MLGNPEGNLDTGVITGSYFGLIFLGACYAAIGIFASILSPNQIVSFILAIFMCFLAYFGFEALANLQLFSSGAFGVEDLGINAHYESISRGVIDTRDLVYFFSFIFLFLALTNLGLTSKRTAKK